MKSVYKIAQIMITIEAPFYLVDSGGFVLYRERSFNDEEYTEETLSLPESLYEIRMEESLDFPAPYGRVLFHNEMNHYIEQKTCIIHYFRIPLGKRASAWGEVTEGKTQILYYRPEAINYFRNSMGCFNAASIEHILYLFDKYILHCSYLDVGGEALLFSAHSGGGKTTHGLIWEKKGLGEMINGDRAILERRNHSAEYVVHGLPIAGSSNVYKNRSLPLRAIFMLEKAAVNEVVDMPPVKKFLRVFEQVTIHTWNQAFLTAATDFVAELVQNVPVKLLRCRPDEGAVEAVREALRML